MKKIITILLVLMMVLSLAACGSGSTTENTPAEEETTESTPVETETPEQSPNAVELCAKYAVEKLKSVLKNPSSLVINNLCGTDFDGSYIFAIEYAAENEFGGFSRDLFFLDVSYLENRFSEFTYGPGSFADIYNQRNTAERMAKVNGYYILDPETLLISSSAEGHPECADRVKEKIKLQGENSSYEGAWDAEVIGDVGLRLVYFNDDVDLNWYKKHPYLSYEITISAILNDGVYTKAEILEDRMLNASDDTRFQRFGPYDREYFKENVDALTPLTQASIKEVLSGNTFKMRNNYRVVGEGTHHTITFLENGMLNTEYPMFDSWSVRDGAVVLTDTYTDTYGKPKTSEHVLTPYQYDETRFLLLDEDGDYSMALTIA